MNKKVLIIILIITAIILV